MTIEAVIWEFGGVFTTSPFVAFNAYEAAHGLPKDLIRTVNATNPDNNAWARFERNDIDAARFDQLFLEESTALGHPLPGGHVPMVVALGADALPLLGFLAEDGGLAAGAAHPQSFGYTPFGVLHRVFPAIRVGAIGHVRS